VSEEPRLYLANQQAAQEAARQVEHLSDEELSEIVLEILKKMGYPGDEFPADLIDTTRDGLLDFIAGSAAIAKATPVKEQP
jgi:restriction endonuclease Mrr